MALANNVAVNEQVFLGKSYEHYTCYTIDNITSDTFTISISDTFITISISGQQGIVIPGVMLT